MFFKNFGIYLKLQVSTDIILSNYDQILIHITAAVNHEEQCTQRNNTIKSGR